jgi:hypothetical protein
VFLSRLDGNGLTPWNQLPVNFPQGITNCITQCDNYFLIYLFY